jgi:hypothetical protein
MLFLTKVFVNEKYNLGKEDKDENGKSVSCNNGYSISTSMFGAGYCGDGFDCPLERGSQSIFYGGDIYCPQQWI